jgi:hypothetical protein
MEAHVLVLRLEELRLELDGKHNLLVFENDWLHDVLLGLQAMLDVFRLREG